MSDEAIDVESEEVPWTRQAQQRVNQQKLQVLMQMGVDVNTIILATRLNHLIDMLLPEDAEDSVRTEFDDAFEVRLEQACDQAAQEVRQQLTQRKLQIASEMPKLEAP